MTNLVKLTFDQDQLNLQTNVYDMQICFPGEMEINNVLHTQQVNYNTFEKLIFTIFIKKEIFLNQTNLARNKKFKSLFEQRKKNNEGENDDDYDENNTYGIFHKLENFHKLMRLGTDYNQFLEVTGDNPIKYFNENFQTMFIEGVIEMLSELCGCDVRVIDLTETQETNNVKLIQKMRLKAENLLYQGSIKKNYLPTKQSKIQRDYLYYQDVVSKDESEIDDNDQSIRVENEYNFANEFQAEDNYETLNKSKQINSIIRDNRVINHLIKQPLSKIQNPYKDFLDLYPWPTFMKIDIRLNTNLAHKLFINYPFNRDDSVRKIKFKLAKLELKKQDTEEGCKVIKNELVQGQNPYMTNLYNFQFGVALDSPNIVRLFPQDRRIQMCCDVIFDYLNVQFFEDSKISTGFNGLHYWYDKYVLEHTIAQVTDISLNLKYLSDSDLLMIKHQWGNQIAQQFLFINQMAKLLNRLVLASIVLEIVLWILGRYFITVIFKILFAVVLICFTSILLIKQRQKEKLADRTWGLDKTNTSHSYKDMKKITTFQGSYIFDIQSNTFEFLKGANNMQKVYSWLSILLLFIMMSITVAIFIELKFKAMKRKDSFMELIQGLLVTGSVKVYQVIWFPLSQWFAEKENFRTQNKKFYSLSLKNFIFNYFNLFQNFFQIAFFKRQMLGGDCVQVEYHGFDGSSIRQQSCMVELTSQIIINFGVFLALNAVEIGMPFLMQRQSAKDKFDSIPSFSCQREIEKDDIENLMEDQLEIIIQLTMVLTFGVTFPSSVALLQFSILLEIRIDLLKFAKWCKRGQCRDERGIGIWQHVIEVIGVIAIMTNVLLLLIEFQEQNSAQFERQKEHSIVLNDEQKMFLFFIFLQQLFIGIKQSMNIFVKDIKVDLSKVGVLDDQVRQYWNSLQFASGQDDDDSNDILTKEVLKLQPGEVQRTEEEFDIFESKILKNFTNVNGGLRSKQDSNKYKDKDNKDDDREQRDQDQDNLEDMIFNSVSSSGDVELHHIHSGQSKRKAFNELSRSHSVRTSVSNDNKDNDLQSPDFNQPSRYSMNNENMIDLKDVRRLSEISEHIDTERILTQRNNNNLHMDIINEQELTSDKYNQYGIEETKIAQRDEEQQDNESEIEVNCKIDSERSQHLFINNSFIEEEEQLQPYSVRDQATYTYNQMFFMLSSIISILTFRLIYEDV